MSPPYQAMRIVNEKAYTPTPFNEVVELKVTVMLDAVPGAWHQPEDIMKWIAQHSYVQSVDLLAATSEHEEPTP